MNMHRRRTLLQSAFVIAVATLAPGISEATNFCVTSGNQLQSALNSAAGNNQNDVIKIVEGTHSSDMNAPDDYQFRYWYSSVDADNALTISGGWTAADNCMTPTASDPAQTVLDAQYFGPVFNIQPYGGVITLTGDITISNLTFARGRGVAFDGIGYPAGVRLYIPEASASSSIVFDNILVASATSAASNVSISQFYMGGAGFLRLRNSIFQGNTLTHPGTMGVGVRTSGNAVGYVNNNSVFGNITESSHSGMIGTGVLTFSNNVIADNQSTSTPLAQARQFYAQNATTLSLYSNHFQTMGFAGSTFPDNVDNHTSGDPRWTQVGSHMVPNNVSPLRNSGINNPSGGLPSVDFSGDARIVDDTIDRGAVEGPTIPNRGPTVYAASPAQGSHTYLSGVIGQVVPHTLTFSVTGGAGSGTTQIGCWVSNGDVVVHNPSWQTVGVGDSAVPVTVSYTITANEQYSVVLCLFTPQNGMEKQMTYFFHADPGHVSAAIFSNSFED